MKTMKYFSAKWCGPCRTFRPIMEEVAGEESIIVEFIDVDNEQNKAEKYKVVAISIKAERNICNQGRVGFVSLTKPNRRKIKTVTNP